MTAIGETLRCERVRRTLELPEISQELKIPPRFLDAIEREAFDELPGAIFVKSFVRQYARFLGLDEDEMAAEAQRIVEPVAGESPAWNHPMPPVDTVRVPPMRAWRSVGDGGGFRWLSSLPALGLVVAAMLVCSLVYAWWQRERRSAAVPAAQATASARQTPAPAVLAVPAAPPPAGPVNASPAPAAPAGGPALNARPAAQTAPATPSPAVNQLSSDNTAPAAKGLVRSR